MDIKTKEDSPMSEEFGPNFITLTDEDGNDIELCLLYTSDAADEL